MRRALSLTPNHIAKWGKFSAAGMVAHLNGATEMALGELTVTGDALKHTDHHLPQFGV